MEPHAHTPALALATVGTVSDPAVEFRAAPGGQIPARLEQAAGLVESIERECTLYGSVPAMHRAGDALRALRLLGDELGPDEEVTAARERRRLDPPYPPPMTADTAPVARGRLAEAHAAVRSIFRGAEALGWSGSADLAVAALESLDRLGARLRDDIEAADGEQAVLDGRG